MIRVTLPYHLARLANTQRELTLPLEGSPTPRAILESLEIRYPMLRGTIRDLTSGERRSFIRFFACGEDFSLAGQDALLPEAVACGREPFMIVGAMAGG